ncbi:MAG: DUF2721 domain-containing protein [Erythrobacter sp.]|uniref:DUF2721 domain-containing protein n=1 Tax=Erythrobacter sp. Alg231-14 TaxID=1922225 RepID=UPI000D5620A4
MIVDILSAGIATDLLERTASTARVQQAVELSLAPAFLLVGIGSIMNVMMSRLIWLAGRIERLADPVNGACEVSHAKELAWLRMRRKFARMAIKFSTGAGVVISIVIAVLFLSAYIETPIGSLVAILWVATIGLLITGLIYFLRETLLAADGSAKMEP